MNSSTRRFALLGNSGSGKSSLARALSGGGQLPVLDLDGLAWEPGPEPRRRGDEAREEVRAFCREAPAWIVEGCYGDLIGVALEQGAELIWLDPGVEVCLAHCRERPWEPHKCASKQEQDARLGFLLDWVRAYDDREGDLSRQGHQALFEAHRGERQHLRREPEIQGRGFLPRRRRRVVLRRFEDRDLGCFASCRLDEELSRYQGWETMDDARIREVFTEPMERETFLPGHWTQLTLACAESDEALGDLGLHVDERRERGELGITLHPDHQGRGLAREALALGCALLFDMGGVDRVEAIVDARNAASIGLVEAIGMTRFASEQAVFRGEPCLEHRYRIEAGR